MTLTGRTGPRRPGRVLTTARYFAAIPFVSGVANVRMRSMRIAAGPAPGRAT